MTNATAPARLLAEARQVADALPPLLAEADALAANVLAGIHGRRRAGQGETFWQYRNYMPGDPATLIDWRQSARANNRLFVRQQEWEVAATVWVHAANTASMDWASGKTVPTKLIRARVLALALTSLLSRAGERVGLVGSARRPVMGRAAPELIGQMMLGAVPQSDPLPAPDSAGHARVVYFSDFLAPTSACASGIRALAAQGLNGHLVLIADPAEEDFPYDGRTRFRDPDDPSSQILFGDAGAVRSRYKARRAAHIETLRDSAAAVGWRVLTHRTDRPALSVLSSLYHLIAGERG